MCSSDLALIPAICPGQQSGAPEPYAVVHGWPQLPPGYVLGQIPGVAVDSHNDIVVFTRAENSWPADPSHLNLVASPTVLFFDGSSGKLVSSWGQNLFLQPHGLRVDRHDNIWVTDTALHQVFEFSHQGKLLLTLGTEREPGLRAPAHDGHDSGVMADSIPAACRTPFRCDDGHFGA